MTDEQLAHKLGMTAQEVRAMSGDDRRELEQICDVGDRLDRGERVPGVIVCRRMTRGRP